ncbi:hypothetical protein [Actinomadura sp. BRA 177]|uniref:protein kinase domain-containing protein n=1 Tax=Actinomadura sp. BRA 177 TaxID=2745202 RepID=UPI0034D973B0
MQRQGPLAPSAVGDLGRGLAEGLAAVHACALVHRDLKPGNVIMAPDGPRIVGFGIARATEMFAPAVSSPTPRLAAAVRRADHPGFHPQDRRRTARPGRPLRPAPTRPDRPLPGEGVRAAAVRPRDPRRSQHRTTAPPAPPPYSADVTSR